ncbi:hypothetical protein ACOMHN_023002 [Nucella lapillus]
MEKLEEESAAKFISALIKSVQTLCHGYLEFNNGIEIVGHINLNVDKGSSLHYILEEKVCKNEENSTLFISNSFHAQNQKSDSKSKGKDSDALLGTRSEEKNSSSDLDEAGKLSAISSISTALSKSHEKNRSGSTSSTKDPENLHSKPSSSTAKRKVSEDHTNDTRAAKSSRLSSSPSPVSHFLIHSPHDPSGSSSPVDTKPSVRQLHADDSSGTVLPQTAVVTSDGAGDLGVNLAGSVLERVDDHSNSDLPDRGEDSDGDLEVTFIKEEYVEGEPSACQFENSGGQQYGRGTHQRASSSDMSDGSMYPVPLHHSQSASSTFVPSAHDMGGAQHYGPSTSSQPQPGTSGVRGVSFGLQSSWIQPLSPKDLKNLVVPAGAWVRCNSLLSERDALALAQEDGGQPGNDPMQEGREAQSDPVYCALCKAQYRSIGSLKRHYRQSHMNLPVFRCEKCGAGFMYKDHYVGHMNKHNNTPTFQCTKCPKKFIYKGDMYKHRKLCTGRGEETPHTDMGGEESKD